MVPTPQPRPGPGGDPRDADIQRAPLATQVQSGVESLQQELLQSTLYIAELEASLEDALSSAHEAQAATMQVRGWCGLWFLWGASFLGPCCKHLWQCRERVGSGQVPTLPRHVVDVLVPGTVWSSTLGLLPHIACCHTRPAATHGLLPHIVCCHT
eukprot:351616-Chlamydomonas_euryale.AAC.3